LGVGIGRVNVEMPKRCCDLVTTVHSPCQVPCG
jgi:hypothetical protein